MLPRPIVSAAICIAILVGENVAAETTAAFVDFDKSAIGSLLESRLLAREGFRWVERSAIEQVVKEQKSQALFSAGSVVNRSSLGRILKADVLILLRSAPTQANGAKKATSGGARQVDLVICETQRGLRLAMHSSLAAEPGNENALVNRLEQWAIDGLKRFGRSAADICAVPPFVSNDLSFAEDYLKRAYASVVEQTVFQHGSFNVVELAEADALVKELALAGESTLLERRLPLYVLGEYRHEGQGESRRVRVNLRFMRGKEQVASTEKADLQPASVTTFLQSSVSELLRSISKREIAEYDNKLEARQLADRAREFMDLGGYEEAMPLLEASLLLKAGDLDVRRDAVIVCGKLGREFVEHRNDATIAAPAIQKYRRGLEHMEIWLSANPQSIQGHGTSKRTFIDDFDLWTFFYGDSPRDTEIKLAHDDLRRDVQEFLLRLTRLRSEQNAIDAKWFLSVATAHLSSRERYRLIGQIALELQDLPGAGQRTMQFVARYSSGIWVLDEAGGAELLDELSRARNPEVREAAERLKQALTNWRVAKATKLPTNSKPAVQGEPSLPVGTTQVTITPIRNLHVVNLGGCIPAGPGIDVFWRSNWLSVMKKPGELHTVWKGTDPNDRFSGGSYGSGVVYDGRYVWASIKRYHLPPFLVILDPVSEKTWEITAEHGLPLVADKDVGRDRYGWGQFMAVTPLEPGRACVAGSFGRSWIALVNFDPDGHHKAKVIHECRRIADPLDTTQWQSTDVAFDPTYVFTLSDYNKGERRVLMGRGSPNTRFHEHPLLIDPEREKVEVFAETLNFYQSDNFFAPHEGSLYFLEHRHEEGNEIRVTRIGAPDWKREILFQGMPQGWIEVFENQIHIIGKRWWSGLLPVGPMHVAAAEVSWFFENQWYYPGQGPTAGPRPDESQGRGRIQAIHRSNHYGLLICTGGTDSRTPAAAYQVNIVSMP